ncbi:hypothetical protein M378DRAFT_11330 [Amanita muscaria Koide BX008]|uniref:Non-specific serine/threonine protein kinase n=1 Tax=Amanita muscaria (strain Koide BX008) TaxID=946122 RepID=A0A0C2X721_AMAMK|nr:hypothetical protein M378DRAFT_1015816 [Amanita muscaria Koide BX008]KIL64518.1 hypothetical protein M378DRAFT_11330 [Amanita muscaria Koide BX008]
MSTSASLQIPSPDPSAGPSRQHLQQPYSASRPVSVSVQPTHNSSSRRQQRASHTPVSSHQHTEDPPAHIDVYAHPAAVAYAAAHPRRQIPKFGPYLLLQTLGEGEFGKVKLGLHTAWGEEVAVKLIRRGNVDSAVRMSKIEREIEVLRILKHPNIVRLYDVIETDKYIGIILEYASGGELFDHILAHRYLRERDAAKLFSQLISGVWYIHQKKIVHRDLKLENLLLDRNRNVIITDFGFANRFEHRTDDLMQTSCGSPCYAAPELVISEGLYVGSAVDIWSCGVILYAMLAGYLPFDDDPANPDGDNINLLYKYIVSTPLSFPDYISSEARDLLSIMLVPDPARRASLEGVMKHSWLGAYTVPGDGSSVPKAFGKTIDDLERVAMEQHQQKRLAYQKQMRTLAAQSTPPAAPDSSKPPRSISYRPAEPQQNVIVPSGRSKSSQPAQSDYIYQSSTTAADQPTTSAVATPATPARGDVSHATYGSPSAPIGVGDDDPFAGPSGSKHSNKKEGKAPETLSPHKSHHQKAATSPDNQFRHTIQVEYDAPSLPKPFKISEENDNTKHDPRTNKRYQQTPKSDGLPPSSIPVRQTQAQPTNGVNENGSATSQQQQQPQQHKRSSKEKRASTTKPLPLPPASAVDSSSAVRSPATDGTKSPPGSSDPTPTRRGGYTSPDSTPQPPSRIPIVNVNVASPPATPGKNSSATRDASEESVSQGSVSSKKGHKKAGTSIDKIGFAKIFGGGGNNTSSEYQHTERVPSNAPSANSSVLLSPSGSEKEKEGSKKNRRNTLTVMVEPLISRTMRSRTNKGRTSVTPVTVEGISATSSKPEKENMKEKAKEKEKAKTVQIPQSAVMEKPFVPGELGGTTGGGAQRDFAGLQASTKKALSVMQWFRTKSKGARDDPLSAEGTSSGAGTSPVPVFVTTPATPGPATAIPVSSQTPLIKTTIPQRAASTATGRESLLSTPSLVKKFRNSMTVATGGTPFSGSKVGSNAGVMRIRPGVVTLDQNMVTTRPPPEVMKHVREVLEAMGLAIQVETEFKFKCVRPKKKKKGVVGGDGAGGSASGSGTSLAAVTMVGSAASNGIDKRGLPLPSPSTFSATGGMLRGLLMRRQSSQVSSSATTVASPVTAGSPNQTFAFDDETSVVVSEPLLINETAYGDLSEDAGDEVRFSVELTRIQGLNDTYSLDVRRLKGTLRSYKYLYDTLRQRANLQR